MLKSLEIANFRGVRSGTLTDLAQLTVLVGANNAGKSTILEAFFLAQDGWHNHTLGWLLHRRVWMGLAGLRYLFNRSDGPQSQASFKAKTELEQLSTSLQSVPKRTELVSIAHQEGMREPLKALDLTFEMGTAGCAYAILVGEDGRTTVPTRLYQNGAWHLKGTSGFCDLHGIEQFGSLEDSFSEATKTGEASRQALLELAVLLRPGLRNLQILKDDSKFILHLIDDHGATPMYLAGDGYKRLFHIATVLASHQGQLVLLEEPEAFQHPRSLEELSRLLWGAVNQGTQVVLSTHSLELLKLLFADHRDTSKAAIIRVELTDGELRNWPVPGPEAANRLEEIGEDLRR